MGVLFQAFYWNCPSEESQDGTWWNFLAGKIPGAPAGRLQRPVASTRIESR